MKFFPYTQKSILVSTAVIKYEKNIIYSLNDHPKNPSVDMIFVLIWI